LKNVQFGSSPRQVKILTTDIHEVFRGLKFEPNADIGSKGGVLKLAHYENRYFITPSIDKSYCRHYFSYNFIVSRIPRLFFKKESIMVEVTEVATKQIAEYFKGKKVSPIRIFLNSGG
jgi:hypothetical protein